jgi:hypothetical protein
MARIFVFLISLLLMGPPAVARELAGVTMSDQVTLGTSTLQLNGMGVRKQLWIKVYVAGLYLQQKTHNPEEIYKMPGKKRLEMHFLTNKANKGKMDSAWEEGFKKNNPEIFEKIRPRVMKFRDLFGDMHKGDVLALTVVPGEGVKAEYNGEIKGTIEGADFAKALLRIWFGPHPPGGDLKKGLLGE